MTDQEKINKMAEDICRQKHNCNDPCNPINSCMAMKYAYRAHLAGYRLQSEVAREIFADVEQNSKLLFDGVQNIVVMTETDFEKIKKKYAGEQT